MRRSIVQRSRPEWQWVVDTAALEASSVGAASAVLDLCVDEQRLVLLRQGSLSILDERGWQRLALPTLVSGARQLARYGQGFALGTPQGLFAFEPQSGVLEQLDAREVCFLENDYAERLWVGGEGLFCAFEGGRHQLELELVSGARVRSVHLGADGCVYAAVQGAGVYRYAVETGQCTPLEALSMPTCSDVIQLSDGTLAVLHQPLDRAVGQRGLSMLLPNGRIEDVHLFSGGERLLPTLDLRVFALSGDRVWSLRQRHWSQESAPNDKAGPGAYRLRKGPRASLWLSTPSGVARYTSFSAEQLAEPATAEDVRRWEHLVMPLSEQDLVVAVALGVGWADGRFDHKESSELQRHLGHLGRSPDSPVGRYLRLAALARPGRVHEQYLRTELKLRLAELDDERASALRSVTLEIATAIADASGGFLGFGQRISPVEREFIETLARELGASPAVQS